MELGEFPQSAPVSLAVMDMQAGGGRPTMVWLMRNPQRRQTDRRRGSAGTYLWNQFQGNGISLHVRTTVYNLTNNVSSLDIYIVVMVALRDHPQRTIISQSWTRAAGATDIIQ